YEVELYFDKGKETTINTMIDAGRLGLAISNLLDNAIKYNVKNGTVTVKIERLTDKPYLQVSIKDNGIGIPPEEAPKLFTKFFRSENAARIETEGSGLGLYITKNIIERHGGAIWAESILGRGTTFYFTLPLDPKLIPPREAPIAIDA
ncbi:MAG: ATP-binding protein, partial [Candidatus Colwellbacteria bacterium]|nr:ATP-binding protein [Candidatus Colwellbacteria bacterium]